ncbi:YY1-associated factor 2 [Portunus trituberculatus]|uniref:YY1-associated factor 2 n=1 Tax=Portunus trituberculatus TaxID=210409 RepID=A0A5B7GFL4_PORTR|nr:YY1-associated factor 2 [Portunus trituberculatus]
MWDCSVCTYRNSPEAFKCLMCDVRKGTSTRSTWCHSLYLGRIEHCQQGAQLSSFRSDHQQTLDSHPYTLEPGAGEKWRAFLKPLTCGSRWSHVPV